MSSLLLKTQGNKATQFFLSQSPIYCYCCCYSCWVLSKRMTTWCASVLGSNCLPKFAYRSPTTLAGERDGEYIRNIDGNGNDCETSQPKDYRVTFPSTQVLSLPKRAFSLAVLTKGTKLAEYALRSCFLSTGTGLALSTFTFCHPVLSPPTRTRRSNKYLSGSRLYVALSCAKAWRRGTQKRME